MTTLPLSNNANLSILYDREETISGCQVEIRLEKWQTTTDELIPVFPEARYILDLQSNIYGQPGDMDTLELLDHEEDWQAIEEARSLFLQAVESAKKLIDERAKFLKEKYGDDDIPF